MKIKPILAFAACAALVSAALLAGCETESADSSCVTISPDYAKLSAGQTVTLTASGWDNFTWSCNNGQLSSTRGKSVVYRALSAGTHTVTASALTGGPASKGTSANPSGTNTATVASGSIGAGTATIVVE